MNLLKEIIPCSFPRDHRAVSEPEARPEAVPSEAGRDQPRRQAAHRHHRRLLERGPRVQTRLQTAAQQSEAHAAERNLWVRRGAGRMGRRSWRVSEVRQPRVVGVVGTIAGVTGPTGQTTVEAESVLCT